MRILLISDCYAPSRKSGAMMMRDLAAGFVKAGHEAVVLTCDDTIRTKLLVRDEDGATVARVRTGQIKGAAKVLRAIQEARLSPVFWNAARDFLLAHPADLIVFYSPSIFFGALVGRLKALWRCPAYLILRDLFPQWAVDAGLLKKGLVWSYFRRVELRQYAVADCIGVQSPANLHYFRESLPDCEYPLEVLYNWASLEPRHVPARDFRGKLGLQDRVIFFYGGNLGVAQDLGNIIRLAAALRSHAKAHFLLVGEGSESERLKDSIRAERLTNIQVLPSLPEDEYLALLSESDVGLVSLDRRLKTHNLPGKLLSYMERGKPVLASVNAGNDLQAILEAHRAGVCLVNGEDQALASAARRLTEDDSLRVEMGRNSRRLLEHLFSADAAVQQILRRFAMQSPESGEGFVEEAVSYQQSAD